MRIFLCILILAIFCSGYSAAAHAFGNMDCHPQGKAEISAPAMDMANCPDHQKADDTQKDADGTSSKAKCMDCTHCCAPHAMNLPSYSLSFQPSVAVLNPPLVDGYIGDYLFSLLRPPRTLV